MEVQQAPLRARIVDLSGPVPFQNSLGEFWMRAYLIAVGRHVDTHLAIVHGSVSADAAPGPVPVRVNSACLTSEAFGDERCDCAWQMWEALARFVQRGKGVLTYHPDQEGRGAGLFQKVRSYALMHEGALSTADAFVALGELPDQRDYSAAAAILRALYVGEVELLTNNPDKAASLSRMGIDVRAQDSIVGTHNGQWHAYLRSKATAFGHHIVLPDGTAPIPSPPPPSDAVSPANGTGHPLPSG